MPTTAPISLASYVLARINKNVMIEGIPIDIIKPHSTKKLQIKLVIDIRPSYFQSRPIVLFAP